MGSGGGWSTCANCHLVCIVDFLLVPFSYIATNLISYHIILYSVTLCHVMSQHHTRPHKNTTYCCKYSFLHSRVFLINVSGVENSVGIYEDQNPKLSDDASWYRRDQTISELLLCWCRLNIHCTGVQIFNYIMATICPKCPSCHLGDITRNNFFLIASTCIWQWNRCRDHQECDTPGVRFSNL